MSGGSRLPFRQIELAFDTPGRESASVAGRALCLPPLPAATNAVALQSRSGRDRQLEAAAQELLHSLGAHRLAEQIRVEWNPRLRTCAGRADFRHTLVTINPKLRDHGPAEIDRTLRHELAHLLAQYRFGRRRIAPHGVEWRQACRDLGIAEEARCHNLPFPISRRVRRFLYRCPHCRRDFPRVRRIKRVIACLACCRAHSRGKFDARFRLKLISVPA